MRKKLALLTAGAMVLSLLLSACGSQAGSPAPDPTDAPSPSAAVEPTAAPEPKETASAEAAVISAAPSEEPSQAVESAAAAVVASAAPQVSAAAPAPSKAPAAATPKPVVSTPVPAAPATPAPAADTPQPTPEPVPAPTPTPAPPTPAATKEAAMAYIGGSASSMIAAIGQPLGRSYAPSCMGEGEDGELFYNGFTVYTYREGGVETVQDVI